MVNSSDLMPAEIDLDPQPVGSLVPNTGQPLLRFSLGLRESALFPLADIKEILKIEAADILPVPDLSDCILGICNWRGTMLWLTDLNSILGYPPLVRQAQEMTTRFAIVVDVEDQALGLVVAQVSDIEFHELQPVQPEIVSAFPPNLIPFISGVLLESWDPALDVAAIIQYYLHEVSRTDL